MKPRNASVGLAALALVAGAASPVLAGGYDTPILYSARHIGMGGTAISFVDDPSAIFHNPAGLANLRSRAMVLGDFSLLIGNISAPVGENNVSHDSETTFGTFFLLGAGFQITDWFAAGVAVYPVASAGATYEYANSTSPTVFRDYTRLVFIEVAPSVAFGWDFGDVEARLGAAWRVTIAQLEREKGPLATPTSAFGLDMSGVNLTGFKLGLQVELFDTVSLGVVYRHKVTTELKQDSGTLLFPLEQINAELTLPSKLGVGARVNTGVVDVAFDFEYGFNSQNEKTTFFATPPGTTSEIAASTQIFEWQDAFTLRPGLEAHVADNARLRLGYVYDSKTANKAYPTAFGTPPVETHSITLGWGMSFLDEMLDVNFAYAYRFGNTTVTAADKQGATTCAACSFQGDYDIGLHAFYLDVGGNFDF